MSWFSSLFKKKEKVVNEIVQEIEEETFYGKCTHCGIVLYSKEGTNMLGKDRYHKRCLRKLMKGWKKDLRNGTLGK